MNEVIYVNGCEGNRSRVDYALAKTFITVLKYNKRSISEQQFRTLKGAALAGDIEGAYRGLYRILQNKSDIQSYNTSIQRIRR